MRPLPVPGGRFLAVTAAALMAALAAGALHAQAPVPLRIHPRVGDTLHTRFEQDVEMTAATKVHGKDTTLTNRTSTLVIARLIVLRLEGDGALLEAITDSVAVLTVGEQAITPSEGARRAMQKRRIQLHVHADGAVRVEAPSDLDRDLGSLVGTMPATLPAAPMSVGGKWDNAVAVPVGGESADAKRRAAPRGVHVRFDGRGSRARLHQRARRDRARFVRRRAERRHAHDVGGHDDGHRDPRPRARLVGRFQDRDHDQFRDHAGNGDGRAAGAGTHADHRADPHGRAPPGAAPKG